ncbi:spermidine synthase [Amycolatopsis sp. CA-230715]|uniref:spermidine synthase n=1 Tax=Amycolatopsis sp. CA-230715 TaxID=2745196 RepID=UPI001C32FCC0|nr:fused MFS/spermidine synthase [Amycolatopsis sp. CA-230715]QWF78445.1 Polyamine aminopropyltransferase [Amycolatopsis sp. CA-230715]
MAEERARPVPGQYPVRFGVAEVLRDADRENGWLLSVDGISQSYVDMNDPEHLEFDYLRRIADVLDLVPDGPLDVVHIGGGAGTLARYVAATRPGSRQLVVDADDGLVDLVERLFGLTAEGIRVIVGDGRAVIEELPADSADFVVLDAFQGASVPGRLATAEFLTAVAAVLRPGGTAVLNISDGTGLAFAKRVAATVSAVFPHALLLAEPMVLRGRRFSNLVLAGSTAELPIGPLRAVCAAAVFPARCVAGDDLEDLCGDAEPLSDADPVTGPEPPPDPFAPREE